MSRPRRDAIATTPIDFKALAFRERWAGDVVLGPLLKLTRLSPDERSAFDAWRLSTWTPQRTLHYCWSHVDPIHGCGGTIVYGRPRRPNDPRACPWQWSAFVAAFEADRVEINAVTSKNPEQGDRLGEWLRQIKALAQRRDTDARPVAGAYYETLKNLGYDAQARVDDDE